MLARSIYLPHGSPLITISIHLQDAVAGAQYTTKNLRGLEISWVCEAKGVLRSNPLKSASRREKVKTQLNGHGVHLHALVSAHSYIHSC